MLTKLTPNKKIVDQKCITHTHTHTCLRINKDKDFWLALSKFIYSFSFRLRSCFRTKIRWFVDDYSHSTDSIDSSGGERLLHTFFANAFRSSNSIIWSVRNNPVSFGLKPYSTILHTQAHLLIWCICCSCTQCRLVSSTSRHSDDDDAEHIFFLSCVSSQCVLYSACACACVVVCALCDMNKDINWARLYVSHIIR